MPIQKKQGFTIIELIVILVVVGVIGAAVTSRFLGNDSLNGAILRDQIVSLSRIALQSSLGREDMSLTITPSGDDVTVSVLQNVTTIQSVTTSMRDVTLTADINDTGSCDSGGAGVSVTNGNPLVINFGSLGDLEDSGLTGSFGAVTTAVRICINDLATDSVCVSPAGFAYAGNCDD